MYSEAMKKVIAMLPFVLICWGILMLQASCAQAPQGQDAQVQPPWYEGKHVEPVELGAIKNASRFGEAVYFGGQVQPQDVEVLRQKGIKTVINLRRPEEMEQYPFDEEQMLAEAGMDYYLIPFGHEVPPEEASLERIAELLDNPANHPVLLHCGSSNRVGYTWARFRAGRHDLTLPLALEEGKAAGMRAPHFETHLKEVVPAEPGSEPSEPDSSSQEH